MSVLRTPQGFTVVELIAVIVLLSVLGVVAMGRMTGPDMFAPTLVSQTLATEMRFAQQLATSRQDAVVSVTLDRLGTDWRLQTATDVDGVIRTQSVDAANTAIDAVSGPAAANLSGGTSLSLSFDHSGNVTAVTIGGTAGTPATGIAVTVSGDTTRDLCIYPSGYVHQAICS